MMSLEIANEKWFRKTMAAFRAAWARNVASAESFQSFIAGVSAASGIPEGTVAASLPAQNYKEFQANASKYLAKAVAKIEAAHRTGKWKTNYRRAFGG